MVGHGAADSDTAKPRKSLCPLFLTYIHTLHTNPYKPLVPLTFFCMSPPDSNIHGHTNFSAPATPMLCARTLSDVLIFVPFHSRSASLSLSLPQIPVPSSHRAPPLLHPLSTLSHFMRFLDLSLIFCYYIRTVKERLREAQPTERRDPDMLKTTKTVALTFQPAALGVWYGE